MAHRKWLRNSLILSIGFATLLWLSTGIRLDLVSTAADVKGRALFPWIVFLTGALVQLFVLSVPSRHVLSRRIKVAAVVAGISWLLLFGLHKICVVYVQGWERAWAVGWSRSAGCPCQAGDSNKDCIQRLIDPKTGEAQVGECWTKAQLFFSRSSLVLIYTLFSGSFGVLAALLMAPPAAARVFICYRREDTQKIVKKIDEKLTIRFSRRNVFLDVERSAPGKDYRKKIKSYGKLCDAFLIVIGPSWLEELEQRRTENRRDDVLDEVELALKSGAKVLPLLVLGATMPKEEELPESIRRLAPIEAIEIERDAKEEELSEAMDDVIRVIEGDEE